MQALFLLFSKNFLAAGILLQNLAHVPEHDHLFLGFLLLFFVGIFHINCVRAAIAALHLDIPTALMHHETTAAANGAIFQHEIRIDLHHKILLLIEK